MRLDNVGRIALIVILIRYITWAYWPGPFWGWPSCNCTISSSNPPSFKFPCYLHHVCVIFFSRGIAHHNGFFVAPLVVFVVAERDFVNICRPFILCVGRDGEWRWHYGFLFSQVWLLKGFFETQNIFFPYCLLKILKIWDLLKMKYYG